MVFKALSTLSMRKVPKGLAAGAEEEKLPEDRPCAALLAMASAILARP